MHACGMQMAHSSAVPCLRMPWLNIHMPRKASCLCSRAGLSQGSDATLFLKSLALLLRPGGRVPAAVRLPGA